MSDEQDAFPDDGTDPAADAHVRALLAGFGSGPDGEPMPPEVAARLEETLGRLVAERQEAEGGNVVPLRARLAPRAAVAAAAVVVLGLGGVAAANLGVFGGPSVTGASDSAGGAESQKSLSSPQPSAGLLEPQRDAAGGAAGFPKVGSSTFARDVTALLDRRSALATPEEKPGAGSTPGDEPTFLGSPDTAKSPPTDSLRRMGCPGPEITDGAVPNPVEYDGVLAVLVVHPERDGQQLVEAWTCSGNRLLAGTTVAD